MVRSTETLLDSIKAIFFDMDGVLFDSMPLHFTSWRDALLEQNIEISEEEVHLNEGRTGRSTITEEFIKNKNRKPSDEEIHNIYEKKTALINSYPMAPVITNMPKMVKEIMEKGIETWVVTGSAQPALLDKLNNFYPSAFCKEKMVTGNDVKYGKPDPEPYLKAWERSGFKKEEVLVIENAPLGVRSAVAAGIKCIAINTGILRDEVLKKEGAEIVLPNALALYNWLQLTPAY